MKVKDLFDALYKYQESEEDLYIVTQDDTVVHRLMREVNIFIGNKLVLRFSHKLDQDLND